MTQSSNEGLDNPTFDGMDVAKETKTELEDLLVSLQELKVHLSDVESLEDVQLLMELLLHTDFQQAFRMHRSVALSTRRLRPPHPLTAHARHLRDEAVMEAHDCIAEEDFNEDCNEILEGDGNGTKLVCLEKSRDMPLGVTVRNDHDCVIISRVVRGGTAEKSGLLSEGDEILQINGISLRGKSVNDVHNILSSMHGPLTILITPNSQTKITSHRKTLMHVKANFTYDSSDDPYVPCRELALSFSQGDVLHVISQEDPNWWQAYRDADANHKPLAGLIPGKRWCSKKYKKQRKKTLDNPDNDTTRSPRAHEVSGREYNFVSRQSFESDLTSGKFIESGEFDQNLYGTNTDSIRQIINSGQICLMCLQPRVVCVYPLRMASKKDAKRQKFYDIECVLDDCDDEDGYKPLSDSDELNESAEEDELREEGVDSSEEWEPLNGRSVSKRQQHAPPSASVPRRRGRPRKQPPQPLPVATGRSLPILSLYSSPIPRGRGRPQNDKTKIPMYIPTRYPTIIPKPVPFSTPLPNPLCTLTFSPNSTFFPNNQQSNSTPIQTPNPTSDALCQNSTHVPPPDAGPSVPFTSNSTPIPTSDPTPSDTFSPNPTHVSYSTLIPTLISMPNQTGRLLDTDTIKITDSWTEKRQFDEKFDSVKECVASPERDTSPTVIAKRQRLSSPSPPAITPVRRRGRPRKHPPKILPSSKVEPATVSNLTNGSPNTSKSTTEPPTASNLTNEPANNSKSTNEFANSSNLTNEPANTSKSTNESANISDLTNEPATAPNLTNEPANSSNLTNEPATALNPTSDHTDASNHTADLATTSYQTPVGSLTDRGLDENENSVEIIDSDEEDLWEDCVECAEDWTPLTKQNPERSTSSTTLSIKPLKNISKHTWPQLRDVSSESKSKPAPAAIASSSDHQTRRNGRPPKQKNPNPQSAFTPFHTTSKPKHTPNPILLSPHTSAVDLSRVKSENRPDLDQWHDVTIKDEEPVLPDFSPKRTPGPQPLDAPRTPLHSFQLFFSSSVVQTIVRNTNSYAEKRAEAGKTLHWSLQVVRSSDLKPYIIFIRPPPAAQRLPTRLTKGGKKHKAEDTRELQEKACEMENSYGHLFDAIITNRDHNRSVFELLILVNKLDTEPQWVPYSWVC
ncbi:MAGUK p55 subfamily member 5-A [Triplophysa tibetana]|uniref:Protein PALS1 n=1 Tax=Triplophysa tibetana TaxID=1572043 RepID=A0A5A9NGP2_9TELE|nr:MAGUK p55 subfamily member 5-A [Triplophysa tibetana]